MNTFDRMLELFGHAHSTGISLPMHPRRIIALEDAGLCVDLATGAMFDAVDVVAVPATIEAEATIKRTLRALSTAPDMEQVSILANGWSEAGAWARGRRIARELHERGEWDGASPVTVALEAAV